MKKAPRFNEKNGFFASKQSSYLMKKIGSKNSKPELLLRKALWRLGLRYRVNFCNLVGKPDIVLVSKRIAIFVDGDFWHGYNWARKKETLRVNREFWIPKIERTIERDKEVTIALINARWCVIRFWEHEIKKDLNACLERILFIINEGVN